MELKQLRYFVTIAETMSFTGAAERLHMSQPALSYQMRHLEDELGVRLFDRTGRWIALTPDGELFLPLAQAVLSRADEAVRVLRDHQGVAGGEVRLGCNPSVAAYLVPDWLLVFREGYPHVKVEITEGGDLELQHGVQRGSLDFAVVTAPGAPRTLDVIPLGSEDMLVITSPDHRFAGRSSLDLAELSSEAFVLPTRSYNLALQLIDAGRRAGFEPRVACQVGSIEAVKNLVRRGLGVSILPSVSLDGFARQGLQVYQVEGGLTRELNLILAKDRSITQAAQALVEHVRDSVAKRMRQVPSPRSPSELP